MDRVRRESIDFDIFCAPLLPRLWLWPWLLLLGFQLNNAANGMYLERISNMFTKSSTLRGLFEVTKDALAGYPSEVVLTAVNSLCTEKESNYTLEIMHTPNIKRMIIELRSACQGYPARLGDSVTLWTSQYFNSNKPVVILITGWLLDSEANETMIDAFNKAFACRGDVNFVVFDMSPFIETLNAWATFDIEYVGSHLAKSIGGLLDFVSIKNIHIIGHGLGALVMGAAGRYIQEYTGLRLQHMTALDPARSCTNVVHYFTGLLRGDADFIDVIHSRAGGLSYTTPMGDIDFYLYGLKPLPENCSNIFCVYELSWRYYIDTIYPGGEEGYIGYRCTSVEHLRNGSCVYNRATMGYMVSQNKKGVYLVDIKNSSTQGFNGDMGRFMKLKDCGLCTDNELQSLLSPSYEVRLNDMRFQFRTACNSIEIPLNRITSLFDIQDFDIKKKVVILITGWRTDIEDTGSIANELSKAFACRNDTNFLILDSGHALNAFYTWSAYHTEQLGSHIAKCLEQLIQIIPVKNIHLIGYSLGAHVTGAVGRYFQEFTNQTLHRITGLDPAKPCFDKHIKLIGLTFGDADFIDVIHTNPGDLGKRNPIGDIDFYPNGLNPYPPNCTTIICAHRRSWQYFVESIYPDQERNFISYGCTSLKNFKEGKFYNGKATMGYMVELDKKGIFFLEVRGEAPFGMNGLRSTYERNKYCGLCPNST